MCSQLGELFTLLRFLDGDRFPDREEFNAQFSNMKSAEAVEQFHELIQPYVFRRMKGDVEKDLPQRDETLIEVELTNAQKQCVAASHARTQAGHTAGVTPV